MDSDAPLNRFFLLTYPRTASNLLVRILNLEEQPSLATGQNGYFFLPTMFVRFREKTWGRHVESLTQEEQTSLRTAYEQCFESLQSHLQHATQQGKHVFVKEHVPWLSDPVAETRFMFGEKSTEEMPWMVSAPGALCTRSRQNETILSDEFLQTWKPTFLIRHPALAFPSLYRTNVEHDGVEAVKVDVSLAIEMTLHWSRTLYDWYAEKSGEASVWPVVLDAQDIILQPDIVSRYAELLGFDTEKLKFSWGVATEQELAELPNVALRMLKTLHASTSRLEEKAGRGIDVEREAEKWRAEWGKEEGEKLERWVAAAMPDYEYLRSKRLR